jgi:hypothetical protein
MLEEMLREAKRFPGISLKALEVWDCGEAFSKGLAVPYSKSIQTALISLKVKIKFTKFPRASIPAFHSLAKLSLRFYEVQLKNLSLGGNSYHMVLLFHPAWERQKRRKEEAKTSNKSLIHHHEFSLLFAGRSNRFLNG